MNAIRVENLTKTFGSNRAVDGLTFSVAEGEIFGLVGPDTDGQSMVMPDSDHSFSAELKAPARPGQAQDPAIAPQPGNAMETDANPAWGLVVTLSNPYTSRASSRTAG